MGTCRLSLLAGVAALWIGCSGGGDVAPPGTPGGTKECTLVGCFSGAGYEGDFALSGADPNSLQLTTCFNTICKQTPIRFTGRDAWCSGEALPICWLSLAGTDLVHVRLTVSPPAGVDSASLKDGDHYEASIGVSGQAPLLKLDSLAMYTVSQPNGPGCEPVCKSTRLTSAR